MFPGSFSCVDVVSAYSGDVGGLRLSCLFDGPVLGDASFAAGFAVVVASSFGVVVAGCRPEAFAVAASVGGCGHGVHLTRWCWCEQLGAGGGEALGVVVATDLVLTDGQRYPYTPPGTLV